MSENIFNIKRSIYEELKNFLINKGYTIGNNENEIELLHRYPDNIEDIHLPSISIDFTDAFEDEEELGFSSYLIDFEFGVFAKDFFQRDRLLSELKEFLSTTIPLYDFESVTILAYNRISFEDISQRINVYITEQGERKYAASVYFTAKIIS